MIDFIKLLAPVFYVFLIVSSILFGVTLAVNFWLVKTIKSLKKETDTNFNTFLTNCEIESVKNAIKSAKIDYDNYLIDAKKAKKINKKNRLRTFFKLHKINTVEIEHNITKEFTCFIKKVYLIFSKDEEGKGYLTFTKNEFFSVLNTLNGRINEILSKSNVAWLKHVKVSLIVDGIEIYLSAMKFFEKIWVVIVVNLISFCMWFGRIFSPVSLGKYFVKNLSSQNLSMLIYETVLEIIGKELAVIYKKQKMVEKSNSKNIKTAV